MADLRTHRELTERGEAAIVSALLGLGADYIILPHLLLPGMLGPRNPDDLDVVVLGPRGVALIEYRHWHGHLTLAPSGEPWILRFAALGEEARPNPTDTLTTKVEALRDHLQAQGLAPTLMVKAVVVPDRTQIEGSADVPVIPRSEVARWVTDALHGEGTPWTAQAADLLRPPTPPRMVNQYRLTTLLGRSAERTTYLAYDTMKSRVVTLRELPYDPFQRPEELERTRIELLREAKLTMELQHPAIERIEQIIPQDDCYYVVGEWLEGALNLRELLGQGPMSVEAALDMAIACADALSYAHGKGVVHRNVRPENVLLAGRVVKLTNFKLAKKADLATRSSFDLRAMAQENPYAAPEFRLGAEGHHRVDARADIYALGAVLYEALTGEPPLHLDEKYWTAPSGTNPAVKLALDEVLQQALRFDPAQRFSTMAAFRERLLAIREGRKAEQKGLRYCDRRLVKRTRNSLLYRATDTERGREVALKKILLDPMLTPDARLGTVQRLLREAPIAASLVHPRIVSVLDTFIEDEDPYIVMEWLDGHDLREHLDGKRPALSVDDALEIVRQAGEALLYAHGQGIVHRDIKPENLLVEGSRVTILDFGLATVAGEDAEEAGKPGGTVRYMAPEVLQGAVADPRSDVYSLAVVLYELLTNRYPYGADAIMGRFQAEVPEGVAPPSHLNLAVSPSLDAPLLKALSVDPEERQVSMEAFLSELAAAEDEGEPAGFLPSGDVPWKTLTLIAVGAMLIGGVAIGMYLSGPGVLFGKRSRPPVALEATESVAVAPLATESLAPMVAASLAPEPTPYPTPTPEPVAAPLVSWASAPVTIANVTMQVERVEATEATAETLVTLKIQNLSAQPITLFNGGNASDQFSITDDLSGDYTPSVDWSTVSPDLILVDSGRTVEGTLRLSRPIDQAASQLQVLIREDGGRQREFLLRAYRLESR